MTTADDIRAKAITRMAQSLADSDVDHIVTSQHFAQAEAAVDAIGDLLSTGVEHRELQDGYSWQSTDGRGNRTAGVRPCTQQHRFVGSWRNTQPSDWLPPARPPLVVERRNQADETPNVGFALLTPPIDEEYWSYRVRLSEKQAIVGFPKFSTIGIGFAVEDDWNTNFPYTSGTEEIFQHIRDNKGDDSISDDDARKAIALIQEAIRADLAPIEGEQQ